MSSATVTERIREITVASIAGPADLKLHGIADAMLYLCDEVDRLSQRIDDLEKRERSAP